MPTELAKQYEAALAQGRWLKFWDENGYFNADPNPAKKPHTIMIPLPNVTGALHMGHCLNGTVQDLLTRWRRMQGYEALWMPGTDHAGIATQAVVERRMFEEEKLTRHDIGRPALVERIWKWKDQYEARILNQLKQLGSSCDWRRTRFTLDEVCSKAVRETFFKLFRDDLIFRGERLVNWDTHLQTAVANDEVFHETVKGHFWTFTYPLADGSGTIAFSTTRPETMLGDTAVAVHPEDERYKKLIGKMIRLPLDGREIPIIADPILVDRNLGTGVVKVTPAHDYNDYACGLRHKLPLINLLSPDGSLNENAGKWAGRDRYEARREVVAEMERLGHFISVEDRDIEQAHSDRSKTPVEPYLSDQWFVRMETLAENAMAVVRDGKVRFYPARYTKTYLDWLGEKRDWCISRQLWWGHQIPIWYCETATEAEMKAAFGGNADVSYRPNPHGGWLICSRTDLPADALGAAHSLRRDEDVLDTWFSSALWPHETLGWPEQTPELAYFYPTSVLVTSRDIITLWVARMVIMGLYNMGQVPFAHVHVHPKIQDGFGQTMSKSKGNGVDPLDLIDKYGVDAVRFTMASLAGESQDVRLPVGYECPACGEFIPQTIEHQKATPSGGAKPRLKCPKCKATPQYSSPWFTPDEGEPVARTVSDRFEYGRNFCNKLWNAARFAMLNLEAGVPNPDEPDKVLAKAYTPGRVADGDLRLEDRWILSRLATTVQNVTTLLGEYHFDAATRAIRDFTWNEFCDWYLEMIKARLRDESTRTVAQRVLVTVLDNLLRTLSPFTPFICEELWQRLGEIAPERGLPTPQPVAAAAMIAPWPTPPEGWRDLKLENRFARLQETIIAVRNVRAVYGIASSVDLSLHVRCAPEIATQFQDVAAQFENLAKTCLKAAGVDVERPAGAASFSLSDADGYIPLAGVIDRAAELARQKKEAEKLKGFIVGHQKKLGNESFVAKAPLEVVAQVRETLANLESQLASVEEVIKQLGE